MLSLVAWAVALVVEPGLSRSSGPCVKLTPDQLPHWRAPWPERPGAQPSSKALKPLVQPPSRHIQRVQMWLCTAWMARTRFPSDSCGRAEMCGHRLIQRRQVLVSLLFSAVNGCESS